MLDGIRKLSRKEFSQLVKEAGNNGVKAEIIGETILKKYKETNTNNKKYQKLLWKEKEYIIKSDYVGVIVYYIDVGSNHYVTVKNRQMLWIPLLFLTVFIRIWIAGNKAELEDIPIIGEAIQDYIGGKPEQEYMTIFGLEEKYVLTHDNKEIYLINPKGNTVYFKYIIRLNDVVLIETDYIAPDKMDRVNLFDVLPKGKHMIDVLIQTIDVEEHYECNAVALTAEVTVEK